MGVQIKYVAGAVWYKANTANHHRPIISTAVFIVFAKNKIDEDAIIIDEMKEVVKSEDKNP